MAFSAAATPIGSGWRDRAVERSPDGARTPSLGRGERLVEAARELANETGSAAFTVAQVAERAGLSLKSFYRCFAGKDDLLVALLAEDSRLGQAILVDRLARHTDPVDRARAWVHELFAMLTHPGALGYAGVLVREHHRLGEDRPDDLRTALAPIVGVLAAALADAAAAGSVRPGDPERDAETVFALVLTGIHDVALGRADAMETASFLWRFCWTGLREDEPAVRGEA